MTRYVYPAGQLTTDALGKELTVQYSTYGIQHQLTDVLTKVTHDLDAGTTEMFFHRTRWTRATGRKLLLGLDERVDAGVLVPSDAIVSVTHP